MSELILPNQPLRIPEARTKEWIQEYVDNRWLGLGDISGIETKNVFAKRDDYEIENPHIFILDLMRKPENFGFTCKHLFGKTLAPFQLAILKELWVRPFPMLIATRGSGKTWCLALYSMLRLLFNQGTKIVIVGAGFRQAKFVFDYMHELWTNGPVYRDIVGTTGDAKDNGPRRSTDRCTMRIGESIATALPIGTDGGKIRGQRANIIIADEFASMNKEIFETVVSGFAAVSLSPVKKFQKKMKEVALKELALWNDEYKRLQDTGLTSNQTIISGSASYSFNHFYDRWKRYKTIIESRGDSRKLQNLSGGKLNDNLDHKDYSIIRIPIHSLPPDFMDEKTIAQAKATIHSGTYAAEYGACFITDSQGFYKRSLIENCVVGRPDNPIIKECGEVRFSAVLTGNKLKNHVISVDPASERDNFSITVLEVWPDHRRIVHCWTITKARFKKKVEKGYVKENDFYTYAARKIRTLLKVFPASRIAIDSQGGGIPIMEALQDSNRMEEGEFAIYPVEVKDDPKPTDGKPGLHIIEVINFAKADWVGEANHGMRKDFEVQELLFPEFDAVVVALSFQQDEDAGRVMIDEYDGSIEQLHDTLEDCVMEIEDLKSELAIIQVSQTPSGRDHWDTPELKVPGMKKGRMRKDRYSSLLMANMVARQLARQPKEIEYESHGGFVNDLMSLDKKDIYGPLYTGPSWYTEKVADEYYGAVAKR